VSKSELFEAILQEEEGRGGLIVKIVRTVGDLRAFISGLDDGMLVVGVDSTEVLVFVCDYDDLLDEDRPLPALVIES
jgi:hypothetical protein